MSNMPKPLRNFSDIIRSMVIKRDLAVFPIIKTPKRREEKVVNAGF